MNQNGRPSSSYMIGAREVVGLVGRKPSGGHAKGASAASAFCVGHACGSQMHNWNMVFVEDCQSSGQVLYD